VKSMWRGWLVIFISVTVSMVLAKGPVAYGSGKKITLRFSSHTPTTHMFHTEIIVPWAKEIEKRSKGQIKVKLFPGGMLHKSKEFIEAIKADITDITYCWPFYRPDLFHLSHVFDLPGAYPNGYVGGRIAEELYNEYFRPEWEANGLSLAWYGTLAAYDLCTTKPVNKLEDLKGMKLRSAGGQMSEVITALGAVPVAMAPPETYASMQMGVVEGCIMSPTSMTSYKLNQVGKYITRIGIMGLAVPIGFNPRTWKKLPEEAKKTIYAVNREAVMWWGKVSEEGAQKSLKLWKEEGGTVIQPPKEEVKRFHDAMGHMWQDFIEKNEKEGRPARKLVSDLRERVEKYGSLSEEEIIKLQRTNPVLNLVD